jgi:hypothetical protein
LNFNTLKHKTSNFFRRSQTDDQDSNSSSNNNINRRSISNVFQNFLGKDGGKDEVEVSQPLSAPVPLHGDHRTGFGK